MSNHSGSYMLNEVLHLLKDLGIADKITKEERKKLVKEIIEIGDGYDCNSGEITEEIGEEYGFCPECFDDTEEFKSGMCRNCYKKYYGHDEDYE